MDIFLLVFAGILILIGIAGSVLPVLPGPPIAWGGLLIASFSSYANFSKTFLIVTALMTVLLMVFDFIFPGLAVKNKGGSNAGERGAMAGAVAGIFLGPWGIILGPLVGAFIGELIASKGDFNHALKIASGSFVGFLFSTGLKLIWCLMLLFWFLKQAVF